MLAYYGERDGLLLFRKHLKQYLGDDGAAAAWIPALLAANTAVEFFARLED